MSFLDQLEKGRFGPMEISTALLILAHQPDKAAAVVKAAQVGALLDAPSVQEHERWGGPFVMDAQTRAYYRAALDSINRPDNIGPFGAGISALETRKSIKPYGNNPDKSISLFYNERDDRFDWCRWDTIERGDLGQDLACWSSRIAFMVRGRADGADTHARLAWDRGTAIFIANQMVRIYPRDFISIQIVDLDEPHQHVITDDGDAPYTWIYTSKVFFDHGTF